MSPRWVAERALFAGIPLVALLTTVVTSARHGSFAIDFDTVSPEIRSLAHGSNPYVIEHIGEGGHYLWPVIAGLVLLPVAWLPFPLGDVAMTIVELASVGAALRLLGVCDWRIYGIALAWPATINSVQTANLSLAICLLLALGWHERDRARCGLWIGLAVAVKLLAWPVCVWLLATRRWRALTLAAGVQALALIAVLPFVSLSGYLAVERAVERTFAPDSLTLRAALQDHGVSRGIAVAAVLVCGAALLLVWRRDFGMCVVVALLTSPVVWLHYYDLLIIPLALWRVRWPIWLIPLLMVVTPGQGNGAHWQTLATLAVAGATVVVARSSRRTDPGAGMLLRERSPALSG